MARRKHSPTSINFVPLRIVVILIVLVALGVGSMCGSGNKEQAPAEEQQTVAERQQPAQPVQTAGKIELPAALQDVPEQIIEHTGFVVSFNKELGQPNWVAWELTAEEAEGAVPRADDFLPDPQVPEAYRVTTADYRGSGYDRGHMCPAADMKWSYKAMNDCFYMTNICPQDHSLNAGSWSTLEKACRRWALREGSVYIAAGPVFKDGKRPAKIGQEHPVAVPDGFFKVVLSLRKGAEKAIGFYYENNSVKQPMEQTAMSVDAVEALTGMDFFPALDDDLENRLEATFKLKEWR